MKRIGKILSLLLAAVMLLALLPSAAFAEPPQSDPTHQHNWVVQDDTATCTASGKRVWVCTVCGQTYGEASPAKGHKWDSGKVTDTKTGKYVYTTAAFVTGELTASVESHSLSPHMGYDADNVMCTFNIIGGAAPYTMKVYIVYAAYHSDKGVEPSRTVLWETHTINTIGEAKDFKCQVPRTYYYPYYDDGQWKSGLGYLESYVIITDTDGRTIRVEIKE